MPPPTAPARLRRRFRQCAWWMLAHRLRAGPAKITPWRRAHELRRGEWLLFTDADTVHKPGSLARAVSEAQQHGASLLSYSPEQEVHSFWEKAVMPVIFAELAATYRPSQVSDPRSPAAAANGQYILISREAYDAVGGHAVVSSSLLEDVGLARAVKASGRKIFFRYGADAVRTRMYRSFAQLREGWTKNLALLFPSPGQLAILRLTEFVLIVCRIHRRHCRSSPRPRQACAGSGDSGPDRLRFFPAANSPGSFLLGCERLCAAWHPSVLVSFAAVPALI